METISKYEVRCPRCNVSFPVQTKRCIHCGGKTGSAMIEQQEFHQTIVGQVSVSESTEHAAASASGGGYAASPFQPESRRGFEVDEDEETSGRPSILRSASTIMWIALAILFTVMRACQDG